MIIFMNICVYFLHIASHILHILCIFSIHLDEWRMKVFVYWSGMLCFAKEKHDKREQSKAIITHFTHKTKLKLMLLMKCQ